MQRFFIIHLVRIISWRKPATFPKNIERIITFVENNLSNATGN
jgi:hypothetical protein